MLMVSLLFSLFPLSCNELCAQVTNSNYIITISGEETLMRVDRGHFFFCVLAVVNRHNSPAVISLFLYSCLISCWVSK